MPARRKMKLRSILLAFKLYCTNKEEAQQVLAGYIQYISNLVVTESLENIRNKLEIKTRFEQEKLAQDRVKIRNQLDANIQRLNYSLDIANAAGIKNQFIATDRQ